MEIQARPDTQREQGTFAKEEESEVNYHKTYTSRWEYSWMAEASDLKKKSEVNVVKRKNSVALQIIAMQYSLQRSTYIFKML